jgi:hypothetical protein
MWIVPCHSIPRTVCRAAAFCSVRRATTFGVQRIQRKAPLPAKKSRVSKEFDKETRAFLQVMESIKEYSETHTRVRRNDPTVVHVSVDTIAWDVNGDRSRFRGSMCPWGVNVDPSQLGYALLHSASVKAITFDLYDMCRMLKESEGHRMLKEGVGKRIANIPSVATLMLYLSTNETLRKVSLLHRDGDGKDCHVNEGLCSIILKAVTRNTSLEHLEVKARLPTDILAQFLMTAPPSLQTFTLDMLHVGFRELSEEDQSEIGRSMAALQSLTRLELTNILDTGWARDIVHHFTGPGHGTLKQLLLRGWEPFDLEDYGESDLLERQEECRQMGRELSALHSLEQLELTDLHACLEMPILLSEVASHGTLKEIVLVQGKDCEGNTETAPPSSLCQLLQSSGTYFEHVSLQEYMLNERTWAMLKNALQRGTVNRLSLVQCRLVESCGTEEPDESEDESEDESPRDATEETGSEIVHGLVVLSNTNEIVSFVSEAPTSVISAMLRMANKKLQTLCIRCLHSSPSK